MTCIVGLVEDGKVWIGGDSAGVSGLDLRVRADEKVFVRSNMIFGFTGSFRLGQILRFTFNPPDQSVGCDDYAYLCGPFIDALIRHLKDKGFARIKDGEVEGGTFLLGYKGSLYCIYDDFQVAKSVDNFHAVGCGDDYALGALEVLMTKESDVSPSNKLKIALKVAEKFSAGVRRPFIVRSL